VLHEHHLTVERTARYFTIEPGEAGAREVWVVCHGYGQLAERFLRQFAVLDDGRRLIVAPEALARFYLHAAAPPKPSVPGAGAPRTDGGGPAIHGRVGASWMTRQDRLGEIADYVAYLDALARHTFRRVERSATTLRVLGFSQGGATAVRWAAQGTTRVDELILWGSHLPPDLDLSAAPGLAGTPVRLVWGEGDPYYDAAELKQEQARLAGAGVPSTATTYRGGHGINRRVLTAIASEPPGRTVPPPG
jgi:predicted esterase